MTFYHMSIKVGFYRILSTIHKLYQVSPDWIFLFMLLHKVETTIKTLYHMSII